MRTKKVILKGDFCTVQVAGTQGLPQIIMENNEIMYLGEFKQNNDIVAICSSPYVSELIFIHKNLLTRKDKQPSPIEKFSIIQMDTLATLKEISYQLKGLMFNPESEGEETSVTKSFNEDTKYN